MKTLITGITGRIGSQLARALVEAGHDIRGLVWPQDPTVERLAGLPIELVEGSLINADDVHKAMAGVEAVCHLGAAFQAGGPFTNDDYMEINVKGTFHMLEAAVANRASLRHFFFASSDALYDKYLPDGIPDPIREDEFPLQPGGMYALTKLLGEDLCRGYLRNHGLPVTIFRFAMTLGGTEILTWPQFYAAHYAPAYANKTSPGAKAVYAQLQAALAENPKTLIIARDANGRAYKKHIAYADDIVAGFPAALGKPQAVGGTFQLAAPAPFAWDEAVPYLAGKLNLPYIDVRLVDATPTFYEFDLAASREKLGYAPQYHIQRMIDAALYQSQGG
ncbi:MAG TPA: NAD(P)-dependent oxidoreductase [Caldilineaceae bacterium]|nr:NAD(P)-dependent oxidoreductase [Caldilineaceae bacterium]